MMAVAVAAVNLALLRAAYRAAWFVLLCSGPPFALLQVAAWRGWPDDGRPGRRFWLGYLAGGGLVTGALAWSLTAPGFPGPAWPWGTGSPGLRAAPGAYWLGAAGAAYWALARLWGPGGAGAVVAFVAALGVLYLPQVAAGAAGGWVARRRAARRAGAWPGPPPGDRPR
jgi:hypothetical protein